MAKLVIGVLFRGVIPNFVDANVQTAAAPHQEQPKNQDHSPVHVELSPECRENPPSHAVECIAPVIETQQLQRALCAWQASSTVWLSIVGPCSVLSIE